MRSMLPCARPSAFRPAGLDNARERSLVVVAAGLFLHRGRAARLFAVNRTARPLSAAALLHRCVLRDHRTRRAAHAPQAPRCGYSAAPARRLMVRSTFSK